MQQWQDEGFVIRLRPHGENSAIITVFTKNYGRYAGYFRGARQKQNRPLVQIGNLLDIQWSSRLSDNLGYFQFDMITPYASFLMENSLKLNLMQSMADLLEILLPERLSSSILYEITYNLMQNMLESDYYLQHYILWELHLLADMGFSLDLSHCVVTGTTENLTHVSPKSGHAVCESVAEPYADKLLKLPKFLRPDHSPLIDITLQDMREALTLTAYFMRKHIFDAINKPLPISRENLIDKFKDNV